MQTIVIWEADEAPTFGADWSIASLRHHGCPDDVTHEQQAHRIAAIRDMSVYRCSMALGRPYAKGGKC